MAEFLAFLEGFGTGLALVIFIGPVFFTLVKASLSYGWRSGMSVATGIFLSDLICVAILYGMGAASFFDEPGYEMIISLAGAAILLFLGVRYLLRPRIETKAELKLDASHHAGFITKGFLVNFVNPFVFGVWIFLITRANRNTDTEGQLLLHLGGTLLGIFSTDTLKAIFAHRIRPFLEPQVLLVIYRAIGIVMLGFGVRLLWVAYAGV